MTLAELTPLTPLIILALFAIVNLLVIAFFRNHQTSFGLTLVAFAAAFVALPLVSGSLPRQVTTLFLVDRYAFFYMGLLFAAGFVVTLLTYSYLHQRTEEQEEFYWLLLTATLGSAGLVISRHFVAFFLSLETLTVSLYVLIAYLYTNPYSTEAGLKYLILASVSTAFLLFGMALVYASLGTMQLPQVAALLTNANHGHNLFLLTGLGLMIIGIGYKLAVVPFHMWTPDIYQGASAPATAFVTTVSKGGMLALLLRYFAPMNPQAYPTLFWIFALLAAASMLVGNLLALRQNNVKRLLAYSSISHFGYMLVAFLASGSMAITATTYYLIAYFATILAAFGIVTVLSRPDHEAEAVEDYRGLFWRQPWVASVFTVALLSLAGIPLTAGFVGKFYVMLAGAGAALWWLLILLAIGSTIGLYYYLRVVVMMALPIAAEGDVVVARPAFTWASGLALLVLTVAVVWLGVYPTPLIRMIQATVTTLF